MDEGFDYSKGVVSLSLNGCGGERRYIPKMTRREVRQRSGFGCSACGCPIIQYHHIVPYRETADNSVENLVALCPNCHEKADEGGAWSREHVRSLQQNPRLERLVHRIDVSTAPFTVKLGNTSWEMTEAAREANRMLTIGGVVVLRARKDPSGLARISGAFHDPGGEPFAVIEDNEWKVAVNKVWDVEFVAARHLTVRLAPRRITLRMEITDEFLHLQQCFFRRGDSFVKITGDADRTVLEAVSLTSAKTTLRSDSAEESLTFAPGRGIVVV